MLPAKARSPRTTRLKIRMLTPNTLRRCPPSSESLSLVRKLASPGRKLSLNSKRPLLEILKLKSTPRLRRSPRKRKFP